MLNRKLYWWLRKLADYEPFISCIALSDRPIEEAYDLELVLRFVLLSRIKLDALKTVGDVGIFLTERMREVATDQAFDHDSYESIFKQTFETLERTVNSDAFKRYDLKKNRHAGGFLLSQFEVVALGIGFNIALGRKIDEKHLAKNVASIWSDTHYTDWAGSGITATRRLPQLVPLGRKLFAK
jgi:hypothetical protein